MSQRNPMNPRTQNKSYAGVSRKSASSAKPASKAGGSVYTKTQAAKDKQREQEAKQADKEERRKQRLREQALGASVTELPEYKKWRKYWIVCIVVAVACVAVSWGVNMLSSNGYLAESLSSVVSSVSVVSLILGYAFIIACFVIDFKKLRPLRRGQEQLVYSMSKRELAELDRLIEQGNEKKVPVPDEEGDKEKKRSWPWSKTS